MENSKPTFGLSVNDLSRSIHFYRDLIGLDIDTETTASNTALLTTAQGQRFLLAGPDAPAWSDILADEHTVLAPGEKIFMGDPEFEERLTRLSGDRRVEFDLIERPWGDRMIEAVCPDGYGVSLWMMRERSRGEIIDLVRMGQVGFREITADMGPDDQCWRPKPGEWSAREVVHHVADTNLTVLHAVRSALANPGEVYHANPYDQRHYASELRYRDRDIEPSLQLIESTVDTLLGLIDSVPDAWVRSLVTSAGGETAVETYLLMLSTHNLEHLEQINKIRGQLGYPRYTFRT
jgi:catechol 2,3-dioxygenase-like lactoylglutathione lyase family enzyme